MNRTLEIAAFSLESALLAARAGADRIELCENPADGGTTPSYGTLKLAAGNIEIPVFPIIRPRGGDFLYSQKEFQTMQYDLLLARDLGFKGAVLGLLNAEGDIDTARTKALVQSVPEMQITFHRAFDRCRSPWIALEKIIDIGCKRILTSGQVPSANDATVFLHDIVEKADGRIIIMPGSGIRSSLIKNIASSTAATEFHSSARTYVASDMQYINKNMQETLKNITVDIDEIRQMRTILDSL